MTIIKPQKTNGVVNMSDNFPKHLVKRLTSEGPFVFLYINEPDYAYKDLGEYSASLCLSPDNGKEIANEIDTLTEKAKEGIRGHTVPKANLPYEILNDISCKKYHDLTGVVCNSGDYLFKFRTNAKFRDKKTNKINDNKINIFDKDHNLIKEPNFIYRGSKGKCTYNMQVWSYGAKCGVRLNLFEIHFTEIVRKKIPDTA